MQLARYAHPLELKPFFFRQTTITYLAVGGGVGF
jgi:hypothetical protein